MRQLQKFNRFVGRVLGPRSTLWLRQAKHGELAWQRRVANVLSRRSGTALEATRTSKRTRGDTLTRGYDALRITRENLSWVRAQLETLGIEFVELPHWNPYRPRLVISETDLARALTGLRESTTDASWRVTPVSLPKRRTRRRRKIDGIQIDREFITPSGTPLTSKFEQVIIEPWNIVDAEDERADGGTYAPGTLHRNVTRRDTFVEYFTPEAWRQAVRAGYRASWPHPHLAEVREPVDVVYTWVDGNDPVWQSKKNAHLDGVGSGEINETAASSSRFTNRNELMYSLRSLEAYASWVNHIFIVTDGQVPKWLDTSHPKISVVDHRDIFADPSALPVFNSHAIESQLHHIPGLSEHYLYMNDDVLFMRPVVPELFFTGNGMSKFFLSRAPLDLSDPSSDDMPVLSAAKRGRAFMAETHHRTVTNKFKHAPHPQLRSVLETFEHEHQELFDRVSRSRFRHPSDFSIASSLYHYHAYALGKAVPGQIRYAYVDIAAPNAEQRLDWWVRSKARSLDVICINDTNITRDMARVSEFVVDLLEKKFPIPSSFER